MLRPCAMAGLSVRSLLSARPMSTAVDDAASDVGAIAAFRKLDTAFCNIPLDKIKFQVGQHFVSKAPHPQVFVGDNKMPGVQHVAPFAKTTFTWFGEKGNMGRRLAFNGMDSIVDDPKLCDQEVGISIEPLNDSMTHNEVAREYFGWLQAIQVKYLEHLLQHYDQYPVLSRKIAALKAKSFSDETIAGMMESEATGLIKKLKDENGDPIDDTDFLQFKQRVFFKADAETLAKATIRCALDKDMAAQGYVRRHVPLYDSVGREVPLEEAALRKGDVVSVVCTVSPNLYSVANRVGYGLRRTMRSIVMLRQGRGSGGSEGGSGSGSPFGNSPLPGGVVFDHN
jgi:hypothetical protein